MEALQANARTPSSEQDHVNLWMQNVLSNVLIPADPSLLNDLTSENHWSPEQMPLTGPIYECDDRIIHSPLGICAASYDGMTCNKIAAVHHESAFTSEVETTPIAATPLPQNGLTGPLLYVPENDLSPSNTLVDDQQQLHFPFGPFPTADSKDQPENGPEPKEILLPIHFDRTLRSGNTKETDTRGNSPPYIIEPLGWRDVNDYRPLRRYLRRRRNNAQNRRNTHSQAEKDYRERLTVKFKELSSALESFAPGHGSSSKGADGTQMLSKAEILSLATHQIRTLRREKKVLLMELAKSTSLEQEYVTA
jgi:hypothetical protein